MSLPAEVVDSWYAPSIFVFASATENLEATIVGRLIHT